MLVMFWDREHLYVREPACTRKKDTDTTASRVDSTEDLELLGNSIDCYKQETSWG